MLPLAILGLTFLVSVSDINTDLSASLHFGLVMLNFGSFVHATHDVMLLFVATSERFGRSARVTLAAESGLADSSLHCWCRRASSIPGINTMKILLFGEGINEHSSRFYRLCGSSVVPCYLREELYIAPNDTQMDT